MWQVRQQLFYSYCVWYCYLEEETVTMTKTDPREITLDILLEVLEEQLRNSRVQVEKLFPYAQAGDIQRIRKIGQVLEEEYREDGIFIRAWMPRNY